MEERGGGGGGGGELREVSREREWREVAMCLVVVVVVAVSKVAEFNLDWEDLDEPERWARRRHRGQT